MTAVVMGADGFVGIQIVQSLSCVLKNGFIFSKHFEILLGCGFEKPGSLVDPKRLISIGAEMIEAAAEIGKRTFGPVEFIDEWKVILGWLSEKIFES